MAFRVVRLDYWDYHHHTGLVFEDSEKAQEEANNLNRTNPDPLSCYIIMPEP